MEKNSICFVNAYFDTKKKKMENPAKEKTKIKPLERLHLFQIHQHILPAFQVVQDQKKISERVSYKEKVTEQKNNFKENEGERKEQGNLDITL